MSEACDTCRFWWRDGHNCAPGYHEDGSRVTGITNPEARMCRRLPRYVWRRSGEWCGEYAPEPSTGRLDTKTSQPDHAPGEGGKA